MDSIIFDVDGTLWDSTPIVAKAWSDFLASEGIKVQITSDRLKGLFGQLLPDIARQIFPDKEEKEQLRLIDLCCEAEHQALIKTPAPLYEGMRDTLAFLSGRIPLFIVSNCQAGYIEVFLQGTGLSSLFTDHLCPGDTGEAKAENIRRIAKRHHLKAPYYLGDTQGDFDACTKAGIPFIHAAYGFGFVPEAKLSIKEPRELMDLANKLIG